MISIKCDEDTLIKCPVCERVLNLECATPCRHIRAYYDPNIGSSADDIQFFNALRFKNAVLTSRVDDALESLLTVSKKKNLNVVLYDGGDVGPGHYDHQYFVFKFKK